VKPPLHKKRTQNLRFQSSLITYLIVLKLGHIKHVFM